MDVERLLQNPIAAMGIGLMAGGNNPIGTGIEVLATGNRMEQQRILRELTRQREQRMMRQEDRLAGKEELKSALSAELQSSRGAITPKAISLGYSVSPSVGLQLEKYADDVKAEKVKSNAARNAVSAAQSYLSPQSNEEEPFARSPAFDLGVAAEEQSPSFFRDFMGAGQTNEAEALVSGEPVADVGDNRPSGDLIDRLYKKRAAASSDPQLIGRPEQKVILDQIDMEIKRAEALAKPKEADKPSQREQQIERAKQTLNMSEKDATLYVDGYIKEVQNPDTGEVVLVNTIDGTARPVKLPTEALPTDIPQQGSKATGIFAQVPAGTGVGSTGLSLTNYLTGQFGYQVAPEVTDARTILNAFRGTLKRAQAINPERPLAVDIKEIDELYSGAGLTPATVVSRQLGVIRDKLIKDFEMSSEDARNTALPEKYRNEQASRAALLRQALNQMGAPAAEALETGGEVGGGMVRVSNGQEAFDIPVSDLDAARADGFEVVQ